ncbi:hypothetical protein MIND_00543100 [Mycena indigotica]|uniref:Ankyrin n=1 Tax=Mycena indigotica TaxID=2126181 RepID=A0A8H6W8Z7_9AGAR|nr:uncharacterized protein MIND_00543100 [Mycena indigotica]KAF7307486.1 hypothetical protein MIND_00543100 [Mycena indigotica]
MMAVLSISTKPMTVLLDLPVELILLIASSISTIYNIDPDYRLPPHKSIFYPRRILKPVLRLLPDLASINTLSRTCKALYNVVNPLLYDVCSKNEALGRLSVLFAVEHQLEEVVDRLVAAGVSLDFEVVVENDVYGLLHVAAWLGYVGMVQKLLDVYGDSDARQTWVYRRLGLNSNKTALDMAAESGRSDVVRLLAAIPLPSSQVPLRIAPGYKNSSRALARKDFVIEYAGFESRRMYIGRAFSGSVATKNAQLDTIRWLGTHEDCDVNYCDDGEDCDNNYIHPPLVRAISPLNCQASVVKLLLQLGANPNFHKDNDHAPLHIAATKALVEAAELLLDAGAHVNVPGVNGGTDLTDILRPIRHFTLSSRAQMLQLLLEHGADPTATNGLGQTPLHVVFGLEDASHVQELVGILLQFGAGSTVEKEDLQVPPRTPITHSMRTSNIGAVKAFLPHIQNQELRQQVVQWLTNASL